MTQADPDANAKPNPDPEPSPEPKWHEREPIPFGRFLEEFPPGSPQRVTCYYGTDNNSYGPQQYKQAPQLRLFCDHPDCQGIRRFDGGWAAPRNIGSQQLARDYLVYRCRDCGLTEKTYCLLSGAIDDQGGGCAVKVGEFPELHIDLPSSLPTLLGPDYKIFIKGLKCEKRGLGIGAFAYYRRVVENQKGRFFEQIARVAERLNAGPDVVEALTRAAAEEQFTRAIDNAKDFIPSSLLIDGHNPMKMLHRALSIGLHSSDDEKCLAVAHSIRMVLQDLSRRIRETLREEKELKSALATLQQFNQEG